MKGTLFLLIYLIACTPVTLSTAMPTASPTATSTATPTVTQTPTPVISPTPLSMETLRSYLGIDERCSHVCWSGINPGVTSADKARMILGTTQTEKYETTQGYDTHISVYFEKDLVKSIYFEGLADPIHTLRNYIQLLGKPDEIRSAVWGVYHCDSLAYLLYFSSRKTTLEIINGGSNGPNPEDWVFEVALNVEYDDAVLQLRAGKVYDDKLSERQPWLGYGHFQDYLPGQASRNWCLTPDPTLAP